MAIDPELLELMVHTVTMRPKLSNTGTGQPNFGDPVTAQAHVQYDAKHTYADGRLTKIEDGQATLDGPYAVTEEWELTVPWPGGDRVVKITSVEQASDEDGFHHTIVHFGAF